MPNQADSILQKITSKAGWQNGLVTKESLKQRTSDNFSFQYYIANNAFKDDSLKLDAIYFNDTSPVIYIKTLKNYNPIEIIELQKRFWNECRTPLTLIITPQVIKILDNYANPALDASRIEHIELEQFSTTDEGLERLAGLLKQSKLDSEQVLGYTLKLNIEERVDKKLISQLREARKQLHDEFNLDFSTIHDLLGRSLFTLYLEQRDILTKEDIKLETKVSDSFFDLLKNYPNETYTLFRFLKEKFNGDLFPITLKEESAVIENPKILALIYECYTHETDLKTRQKYLFNYFDFKHIPIALISAIYEEFMNEEDKKKNIIIDVAVKGKRELGAYYTPQMLVEFVYNEVLPMPSKNDHNYNIKILDPACGSGIFLVEGFKRIIERWKFSHKQSELSEETLRELLLNNIYGVEIHPEAIKITAFSLYLTFLHHMNPREILRKVKFKPLVYWTKDKDDLEEGDDKKFGLNLLRANTFIREGKVFKENPIEKVNAFFETPFNIVIGNPPWKSGHVDDEIKTWAKERNWDLKSDVIKGFLVYAPSIAPQATIALIASAKVLFNTSGTDDKFRFRFFSENKVSVIANFSAVRNVLFEKAKQAAALIIYTLRNKKEIDSTESIIYCVPKTATSIKNRNTITIDASEIKFLPIQEVLKTNSKIFKIGMYGNIRDLKFINRLNSDFFNKITDIPHVESRGLVTDTTNQRKGNINLGNNLFISSKLVKPYYIPSKNKPLFNTHPKFNTLRTIEKDIFSPPIIIIKIGNDEVDICSSFIDYPCVFESYAMALRFPKKSVNYHKAFTCCLNSSLARYYYFLTSGSWGVDRGRIQRNELLQFPLITEKFCTSAINNLALKMNQIIKIKNEDFSNQDRENIQIESIANDIDKIIFEELKITLLEQTLIDNALNYSVFLKNNYDKSGAEKPVIISKDIKQYAQTYLEVINKHFKDSTIRLRAEIYPNSNSNDELICVKFIFEKSNSNKKNVEESEIEISKLLHEINVQTFDRYSASIYFRRIIKYDVENAFYLIKPNQKRFWTKASALNDADNLIVEILSQNNN